MRYHLGRAPASRIDSVGDRAYEWSRSKRCRRLRLRFGVEARSGRSNNSSLTSDDEANGGAAPHAAAYGEGTKYIHTSTAAAVAQPNIDISNSSVLPGRKESFRRPHYWNFGGEGDAWTCLTQSSTRCCLALRFLQRCYRPLPGCPIRLSNGPRVQKFYTPGDCSAKISRSKTSHGSQREVTCESSP